MCAVCRLNSGRFLGGNTLRCVAGNIRIARSGGGRKGMRYWLRGIVHPNRTTRDSNAMSRTVTVGVSVAITITITRRIGVAGVVVRDVSPAVSDSGAAHVHFRTAGGVCSCHRRTATEIAGVVLIADVIAPTVASAPVNFAAETTLRDRTPRDRAVSTTAVASLSTTLLDL